MTPDTGGGTITATLCRNCQRRPADRPTPYHEATVQYQTTYAITRGSYRPRSVRKIIKDGTAQLCAQCASGYHRSVMLRSIGNRMSNVGFIGLLLGGILFAVVSYAVPAGTGGVFAMIWAIAGILVALVFLVGVLMLATGTLLRGPATRFLRN